MPPQTAWNTGSALLAGGFDPHPDVDTVTALGSDDHRIEIDFAHFGNILAEIRELFHQADQTPDVGCCAASVTRQQSHTRND